MITFKEARELVFQRIGPSRPKGFEDAKDYNVLLMNPPVDDTVILVDKESSNIRRVVYWNHLNKLTSMTPVEDTDDLPNPK